MGNTVTDTNQPTSGGYDLCFLDEAATERLKCVICTKVVKDPHLMVCCGQKFCHSCLQCWFREQEKEVCPHCRVTASVGEEQRPLHVADKGAQKEVESLVVMCSNCDSGCEWVGEAREIPRHLDHCSFEEKVCPNDCRTSSGQKTRTLLKDLEVHLSYYCEQRSMECQECGLVGTAGSMMIHRKDCEEIELKITEKYTD